MCAYVQLMPSLTCLAQIFNYLSPLNIIRYYFALYKNITQEKVENFACSYCHISYLHSEVRGTCAAPSSNFAPTSNVIAH